jgi:hypothetical protein
MTDRLRWWAVRRLVGNRTVAGNLTVSKGGLVLDPDRPSLVWNVRITDAPIAVRIETPIAAHIERTPR